MKMAQFIIFSALESSIIVLLGMALFRFRMTARNIIYSLIIGTILSVISAIINYFNVLVDISPLIQMIVMYVLTLIFFKTKKLYTLLLSAVPYIIYAVFQVSIILLLIHYKVVSMTDIGAFTEKGWVVQAFTTITTALVIFVIRYTNEGYAFDPDSNYTKRIFRFNNRLLVYSTTSSILLFCVLYTFFKVSHNHLLSLILFFCTLLIAASFLIYIYLMRDKEEAEI